MPARFCFAFLFSSIPTGLRPFPVYHVQWLTTSSSPSYYLFIHVLRHESHFLPADPTPASSQHGSPFTKQTRSPYCLLCLVHLSLAKKALSILECVLEGSSQDSLWKRMTLKGYFHRPHNPPLFSRASPASSWEFAAEAARLAYTPTL